MTAVADHLSWASAGGGGAPYRKLAGEIVEALAWPKDQHELAPFKACLDSHRPYQSKEDEAKDLTHHLERAQLKICVDAVRDRMTTRVPDAYNMSR